MPCYYVKSFEQNYFSLKKAPLVEGDALLETDKSWQAPLHIHTHPELLFVLEGNGRVFLDSSWYPIKKGDLVVINPRLRHREAYSSDFNKAPFKLYSCEINEVETDVLPPNTLLPINCRPIIESGKYFERFISLFSQLLAQHIRGEKWYAQICNHLGYEMVLLTLRILNEQYAFLAQIGSPRDAQRVLEYIDAHYLEDINIKAITSDLFISRDTLYRIFQEQDFLTPVEYINRKRIAYSQELIRTTALSMQEISLRSGFANYSHFYRMFKRITGLPPSAFRLQNHRRSELTKIRS